MQILGGIRFGGDITVAARAHGLEPKLLAAVAAQETGGPGQSSGNNVVGDGGHGRGLFQIDDRSWAFARTAAAMDPAQNADKAASILADDLGRYGGDVHKALSAYNTGSPDATGTTTTWADGRTLGYADSVLRHYADLGGPGSRRGAALAGSGLPGATDAREQLVADNPGTSATVNALSSLNALSTLKALSNPNAALTSSPALPPAATPSQTTWRSWASLNQGAGDPAAQADQLLADLVGGSDDSADSEQ